MSCLVLILRYSDPADRQIKSLPDFDQKFAVCYQLLIGTQGPDQNLVRSCRFVSHTSYPFLILKCWPLSWTRYGKAAFKNENMAWSPCGCKLPLKWVIVTSERKTSWHWMEAGRPVACLITSFEMSSQSADAMHRIVLLWHRLIRPLVYKGLMKMSRMQWCRKWRLEGVLAAL